MEVFLEGWRRNCGSLNISRAEVESLELTEAPSSYSPSKTYFFSNKKGDVFIKHQAPNLRLNGDYLASIKLTAEDIAAMARAAFKGRPFDEIIKLLHGPAETD
jgi:hypothetical protein